MFALIVAAAAFAFVALGLVALAIDWYERRETRRIIRRRLADFGHRHP